MISSLMFLAQVSEAAQHSPSRGWMTGSVAFLVFGGIVVASGIWLWMLADCLMSDLPRAQKIGWGLVIFFLHFLGAVLYFGFARNKRQTA